MKFGVTAINAGRRTRPENAAAIARLAEQAGFESLWAVEHVVVPAGYQSKYPYSPDGRMPGKEEIAISDPLVWLAYAAAVTERINIATGVLILPQRNPVILAKECATLDVLSNGRLILGVGIGWLEEEFNALGVPFTDRAKRAEEYVGALRALWTQDVPSFAGQYASFEGALSYPKPVRNPIPIVIGGHTDNAAKRAGRIGDGFFPWDQSPENVTHLIKVMRAAAEEAGRDPDAIEVTAGAMDLDSIKRCADAGVSRVVAPALVRDGPDLEQWFADFSEHVMSKL